VRCFSGHVQCFGLCVYPVSSILSGGHLWKALKKFPSVFGGHLYIQEYPSYKRGGPYTSSLRPGVILHVLYYRFRAIYFRITHTWVRNILYKYPRFIMGVPISGQGELIPTLVFTMIPMWGSICLGPLLPQFENRNFMQPMRIGGVGGVDFWFLFCSHCVPIRFPNSFPSSSHVLKTFPTAPQFYSIPFGHSSAYINWKGKHTIRP